MTNIGQIRKVRDEDWPQLYALTDRVFLRNNETNFLRKVKQDGDIVVCYVMERNQEITAFITYTRIKLVDQEDGHYLQGALAMGPLIVDPIWQGKGIGSKLIAHAHHEVRQEHESLAFVMGEEDYYARFGYTKDTATSYKSPYSGPYLLACKLSDNIPESAELIYPDAFAELSV